MALKKGLKSNLIERVSSNKKVLSLAKQIKEMVDDFAFENSLDADEAWLQIQNTIEDLKAKDLLEGEPLALHTY